MPIAPRICKPNTNPVMQLWKYFEEYQNDNLSLWSRGLFMNLRSCVQIYISKLSNFMGAIIGFLKDSGCKYKHCTHKKEALVIIIDKKWMEMEKPHNKYDVHSWNELLSTHSIQFTHLKICVSGSEQGAKIRGCNMLNRQVLRLWKRDLPSIQKTKGAPPGTPSSAGPAYLCKTNNSKYGESLMFREIDSLILFLCFLSPLTFFAA